jgi:hypothetical protein
MIGDQIIFHHYPQSPVSEKVRVVFGMKHLAWKFPACRQSPT